MSEHYHCGYEHAPYEVRFRFRYKWLCPWPYMVFERFWCWDMECDREAVIIGLN